MELSALQRSYEDMLKKEQAGRKEGREDLATLSSVADLYQRTMVLSDRTARVQKEMVAIQDLEELLARYSELHSTTQSLNTRAITAESKVAKLESENVNLRMQLEQLQREKTESTAPMKLDLAFYRCLMSVGNHLVHTFLQCFSKAQLSRLHNVMLQHEPVKYSVFEELLNEVAPGFCLPSSSVKTTSPEAEMRIRKSIGGDRVMQRAMLKELFRQIDVSNEGSIRWSGISTLVIEMSSHQKPKAMQIFSDVPHEATFEKQRCSASDNPFMKDMKETVTKKEQLGPIGRKVHGVGLYWEEVEHLRYFPAMSAYCLTGHCDTYLFSLDPATHKAVIINKLKGPTAAVFNMYHFPELQRVLVCCADRYIYSWGDSFEKWVATEKIKVHTPQMCMAVDSTKKLLMTGGTDGDILFFTVGSILVNVRRVECSTEWVCDLLFLDELGQLITCSADGKVGTWDVEWDDENEDLTFQMRSVKDAHEKSIKTQVAYSSKCRTLFSIGYGHNVLCWNPFIASQTHVLRGHEKLLTQVQTFHDSHEVISGDISGKIIIWDARTLSQLQSIGGLDSHYPIGPMNVFTFNSADNQLVTIGKRFCVFTRTHRDELPSFESPMFQVLYSSAQKCIITVSKNRVFIWHAECGDLQATYGSFSNSDLSCAMLVNHDRDLAIATLGGEIRFVSLLNGAWYHELHCGDGVVHMASITEHTQQTRHLLASHRFAEDGEDLLLLLITTAKGKVVLYSYGRNGNHNELLSWRSFLDTITLAAAPPTGAFIAVASKKDCEIWSTWNRSLKRAIKCTSNITSFVFISTLQAFISAEAMGVLHIYSLPGFAYLMRFAFLDYMVPTSLVFIETKCQLVCSSAKCIKVLSMRNILVQYQEHNNAQLQKEATSVFDGKYAVLKTEPVSKKMKAGYDTAASARVSLSFSSNKQQHYMEAQLLKLLCDAHEVIDIFECLPDTLEDQYCNVLEACDTMLVQYVRDGYTSKRQNGVTELQCIMTSIVQALSALHSSNIIIHLTPDKIGRVKGTWKVVDVSTAVKLGKGPDSIPHVIDLGAVPWAVCPPEWGSAKSHGEVLSPSRSADIWGLGLVIWLVFKKTAFWEEDNVASIPDKLLVYDLPHRHKVLPQELLLDSVMHQLLDGTLVKVDRRWPLEKIIDHLEGNEYMADDTFDLQPFPSTSTAQSVFKLSERGRYRLSRMPSEPSPARSEGNLRSSAWFQNTLTDETKFNTFVICKVLPQKESFCATCVVPQLNYILNTEWTGVHAVLSVSGILTGSTCGWLPRQETVTELGLKNIEGSTVWEFVPRSQNNVKSKPVYMQMKKLNVLRRFRIKGDDDKRKLCQREKGTDHLSPFYTAFKTCCETVDLYTPFYLRGKAGVKTVNTLDTKVTKTAKHARAKEIAREEQPSKRLGLDFLLATPNNNHVVRRASEGKGSRAMLLKKLGVTPIIDQALYVTPMTMKDKNDFERANLILAGLN